MFLEKIYLDYASTTPLDSEVKMAMMPYLENKYGNPSSTHSFGQEARIAVDKAREMIADFLGCNFAEVYFMSGATEANNLAIRGIIEKIRNPKSEIRNKFNPAHSYGKGGTKFKIHVITSKIEHKSALKPIESLEKAGLVEVTYLPAAKEGVVNINKLGKIIKENTVLVSVMYVNNETGVIQPIEEIRKIVKERKQKNKSKLGIQYPLFHIDAAQAVGHLPINVNNIGCDLLSMSSHKVYGPKGAGALYVKEGTPIMPLIEGGGQENGLRAGTENVAGIAGFGKAIELLCSQNPKFQISNKIQNLKDYLERGILKNIANTSVNGGGAPRAPHISNILFKGVEAESLIIALDSEGVAVSSGSACQAKAIEPSYVLLAMGLSKKEAMSSVRFSLGRFTTRDDIDKLLKMLPGIVKRLINR